MRKFVLAFTLIFTLFIFQGVNGQDFEPPITWQKFITNNGFTAYNDIYTTQDNGILVGGWIDSLNIMRESMIGKLSCEGDLLWSHKIDRYDPIQNFPPVPSSKVVELANGDYVITTTEIDYANFAFTIIVAQFTAGGNLQWKKKYSSNLLNLGGIGITPCSDTTMVVAGIGLDLQLGQLQVLVFKVDDEGELIWEQRVNTVPGDGLEDFPQSLDLAEDNMKNVVLTGFLTPDQTTGITNSFLLSIDSLGAINYWHAYGNPDFNTVATNLTVTSNNEYIITGGTNENGEASTDPLNAFLLKVDTAGQVVSGKVYEPVTGNIADDISRKVINRGDNIVMSVESSDWAVTPGNGTRGVLIEVGDDLEVDQAVVYDNFGINPVVSNEQNGGMFLAGAYVDTNSGQLLATAARTDTELLTGCEETDITADVVATDFFVRIDTLDLTLGNGLLAEADSITKRVFLGIDTFCENVPINEAMFDFVSDSVCWHDVAEVIQQSTGTIEMYNWSWGDGASDDMENAEPHQYGIEAIISANNNFNVSLQIVYECIVDQVSMPIYVDLDYEILAFTVCPGESVEVAGETVSTIGRTYIPVSRDNDCDSLVIVDLANFPDAVGQIDFRDLCFGDEVVVDGQVFTAPNDGTIQYPGATVNGCDSVLIVNFDSGTILPREVENVNFQVCQGETVAFLGNTYQAGDQDQIIIEDVATNGCDSLYIVSVTQYAEESSSISVDVCEGESVTVFGVNVPAGQTVGATIPGVTVNGCDSVYQITGNTLPIDNQIDGPFAVCAGVNEFVYAGPNGNLNPQTYTLNNSTGNDLQYVVDGGAANGCDLVFTFDVTVDTPIDIDDPEGSRYEFPNVFTPNQGGMQNQDFGLVVKEDLGGSLEAIQDYELRVFNRWGEKVFETNAPEERWDGLCEDDNGCPSDVYVWYARISFDGSLENENECQFTLQGDVTLIR